ncbi:MAG TPA: DUF1566 domain-containing protein [Candidatus Binatia bacterium]
MALSADPVCGDVNSSGKVTSSDALLVLKDAVGQPVALECPRCGDGTIDAIEDCDVGNLNGATCVTQGFAGGTLACAAGCTFDTSGCYATRFDASGDTIIDHKTGLEWEKKDASDRVPNLTDPHDVDNSYQWSSSGTAPDGGAFTDFLAKLNGGTSPDGVATTGCYAGHCDWRLPTVEELTALPGWPLGAEFQPDAASDYWSASTDANDPSFAWLVGTVDGFAFSDFKTFNIFVRAVRSGS